MISLVKKILVHDDWRIGVVRLDSVAQLLSWRIPQSSAISWMPHRKGYYVADPFVTTYNGQTVIFYEEFNFATNRGQLAYRTIAQNSDGSYVFGEQVLLVSELSHRSYPSIIADENGIYMIPEESCSNQVTLYQFDKFPNRLVHKATMLHDFAGVDASVTWYQGRYWMFVTHKNHPNTELHIYFAQSLDGQWQPHQNNPVVRSSDVRSAGIPFIVDGVLYRPAQDCAQTYGAAVVINRVDVLTVDNYRETSIHRIASNYPNARGIHTISYDNQSNVLAFDIKFRASRKDSVRKLMAILRNYLTDKRNNFSMF